jgi:hypothetical protein
MSFGLLASPPAAADIGVQKVTPKTGEPGTPAELSVGCGACLAVSVAQGPKHPPAALPIALVPLSDAPEPHRCHGNGFCSPTTHAKRLRQRPFVFLGVAKPQFTERQLGHWRASTGPQYRLRFQIPPVKPGDYTLVIFCGECYRGSRGGLIVDAVSHRALLRVERGDPSTSAKETGTGTSRLIVGGAAVLVLLAAGAVVSRRRDGPQSA